MAEPRHGDGGVESSADAIGPGGARKALFSGSNSGVLKAETASNPLDLMAKLRQASSITVKDDSDLERKSERLLHIAQRSSSVKDSEVSLEMNEKAKPGNGRNISIETKVLATFGLFGQNSEDMRDKSIFESSLDLTPERIGHIFNTLDTNNDGLLSYAALRRGIEDWTGISSENSALNDAAFEALIIFLDSDGSGDISREEFSEGLRLLTLHMLFSNDVEASEFECFDYNAMRNERKLVSSGVESQTNFMYGSRESWVGCRWINIGGSDMNTSLTLQRLAVKYMLHPLAIEDALLSGDHRPKVEVFSSHYFLQIPFFHLVTDEHSLPIHDDGLRRRGAHSGRRNIESSSELDQIDDSKPLRIEYEVVSIFVNVPLNDTLITFQRNPIGHVGACQFNRIKSEIKKSYSKLRQYSAQYLCYAILDMAVDRLPQIAQRIGEYIDNERKRLRANGFNDGLYKVEEIKENLRKTMRQIKPFIRVLNHVIQDDKIVPGATIYLRDVKDNLECAEDELRELVNSCEQLDIEYNKHHALQMDKTLYTLTIISSIFMPLQLLTGIWGMNFQYMPELKLPWGYIMFWILCILMTTSLLVYFKCGRM